MINSLIVSAAPSGVRLAKYDRQKRSVVAGFTVLPPPDGRPEDKTWVEHICSLTKEMSDVIAPISAAACRGGITAGDVAAGDWLREADELIRAAVEFKAALIKVGDE